MSLVLYHFQVINSTKALDYEIGIMYMYTNSCVISMGKIFYQGTKTFNSTNLLKKGLIKDYLYKMISYISSLQNNL